MNKAPGHPVTTTHPKDTSSWLVPSLAYVLMAGALGVASKLALDDLTWQQLTLWTTLVYVVAAAFLYVRLQSMPALDLGLVAAAASGALTVIALIALFLALDAGDVTQVVPVTSAYPVVTLILAAFLLGERIGVWQVIGTVLIVLGVALLSVS